MPMLCSGARWSAAGSLLVWIDSTGAFTVWDGVFFALRRSR